MTATREQPLEHDVESLVREARRRTRRRRLRMTSGVALVASATAAITLLLSSGDAARHASPAGRAALPANAGATAQLKSPGPLAVSSGGTLYVVDEGRGQILRLLPSGKFAVFAGNGKPGFSGDGGPATHASLRLSGWSTISVGADGTVYIADTGNNRVRAVAPDGTIRTVVRVSHPAGLATGPHDRLYIGANDLFSLSLTSGRLHKLAGWTRSPTVMTNHEIRESHFSNAYGDIAVDREGDVFEANFPQLYERTAAGRLRFLGDGFRAGGGAAQLAEGPDGSVYEAAFGVARVSSAGPGRYQVVRRPRSIIPARRIDAAVGDWQALADARGGAIVAPAAGLAVGVNGTIYYDSDSGDGWASGALIEIKANDAVRVLWRAPS
jgi:hypothetical protein